MRHILQIFAENMFKTPKRDILLEKMQVFAKSTIFHAWFLRNGAYFGTFFWKVDKKPKRYSLLEKSEVLAESTIFRAFSRNEANFATF